MRQIKFRGISFEDNDWIYGYLVEVTPSNFFIFSPEDLDHVNGCCVHQIPSGSRQVYKESIGQFIGLLDKDYNEVYEGDIIEYDFGQSTKTIGYVTFLQQELGYVIVIEKSDFRLGNRRTGSSYYRDINMKVIGNLTQNKDLIPWLKKN